MTSIRRKTDLTLDTIILTDLLQPPESPFRIAACSFCSSAVSGTAATADTADAVSASSGGKFDWGSCSMQEEKWGWTTPRKRSYPLSSKPQRRSDSPSASSSSEIKLSLLELGNDEKRITLNMNALEFQWNPSTVVALQRFVGRLFKEVHLKVVSPPPSATSNAPVEEGKKSSAVRSYVVEGRINR